MDMPALLPIQLQNYSSAADDETLFTALTENFSDFFDFFECSADDETWSQEHSTFTRLALEWITIQEFDGRFSLEEAQRLLKKIQQHIRILMQYLPTDISFNIEGNVIPVNSFLFEAGSEILKQYITDEFRSLRTYVFPFENLSLDNFKVFQTFVQFGEVDGLWKKNKEELLEIHQKAVFWGFKGLAQDCERVLTRYIMRGNVIEILIKSHQEKSEILRQAAFDFFNDLDLGCKFRNSPKGSLYFEFLEFRESAMDYFEKVKRYITQLIFRGYLTEEFLFGQVVKECPRLHGLDISETKDFSDYFKEVPQGLSELDVSFCPWLRVETLCGIIDTIPNLKKIAVRNNLQMNPQAWGCLQKLNQLNDLDISNNSRVNDDDFRLILQSALQVTIFKCNDCGSVGDKGFFEISKLLLGLISLEVERCNISDGILVEIASRCKSLRELSVADAPRITDRGLFAAVKQASALQKLNITRCNIKPETLEDIRRLKPSLIVIL